MKPASGSLEERCLDYGGSDVFFWLSVFSSCVLCFLFMVIFHVTASGKTLHDFLKQRVWKRHKKTELEPQCEENAVNTVVTIKTKRNHSVRKVDVISWKGNMERSLGPFTSWWRWLIPVPWLHKSDNKYR